MLILRGPVSAGGPHPRRHVRPQGDRHAGGCVPDSTAPDFSQTFVDNIHSYGRSFEVGLVARHYLRHYLFRLPGMTPMGVGMIAKGRIGFVPHRIKGIDGLRAILARAEDLEEAARATEVRA